LVLALALAGCAAHQRIEPSATAGGADTPPAGSEIWRAVAGDATPGPIREDERRAMAGALGG
jgi:hypothetical protein